MDRVDVAMKEWELVTGLLAEGRQIMLLRKGGIQEGPGGFQIAHRRFALLPTRLHQQADLLKPALRDRLVPGDAEPATFRLTHAAEITDILTVPGRKAMDRLDEFHCWAEPYLEMRWNYRPERPLFLLLLRTYPLIEPFDLKNTYRIAGCRSWVPLERPLALGQTPVVSDSDYGSRVDAIRGRLG